MRYILVYKVAKSNESKCFALEPTFSVERRLSTCKELLIIQKQFIPEFLNITLQYSLKCKVTVWRQAVSKLDSGFVVHLLEAAINREPKGVLCNLGNQYRQGSSSIFDGTPTLISFIYLI